MFCRLIKNILTCNIQIILKLDVSLKTYNNQIENGNYEFPSYSHWCPICSGKDCCRLHGYYYRHVVDETGAFFKDFPIARFICRKKGKVKARTFSLLPWQLIPYHKYMIDFVLAVASYQIKYSINQTLDFVYPGITESTQLYSIKKLLSESLEKLKISKMLSYEINFKNFIDYCLNYVSESDEKIRGPTGLSRDYYRKNGSYYENSQFLFGCAAQFC